MALGDGWFCLTVVLHRAPDWSDLYFPGLDWSIRNQLFAPGTISICGPADVVCGPDRIVTIGSRGFSAFVGRLHRDRPASAISGQLAHSTALRTAASGAHR